MRCRMAWVFAALLCAAPLVMAQRTTLKADVPFPFFAGNVSCSPGEYSFLREAGEAGRIVHMRNTGTGDSILLMAGFLDPQHPRGASPKLVFHKYGERYFLREVHEGGTIKVAFLPGQEERQLLVAGARWSKAVVLARLR